MGEHGAGPAETDAPDLRHPAPRPPLRRGWWDLLGVLLGALVMLGVDLAFGAVLHSEIGHVPRIGQVTVVVAVAVVLLGTALVLLERPAPRRLAARLVGVWADPPAGWAAGVLGALLALPVLGLYTEVLLSDADSARIVAAVTHVRDHGIDFLLETQDNLLPHLLMGPAIEVGGLGGGKLVAIACIQVLAAVVAYIGWRVSRSMLGAAASTLALLAIPAVMQRTGFLPMYPLMLALGYGGAWLAYLGISGRRRGWPVAAGAGLCLALAPEAHALGLLFLATPVLLLAFAPGVRSGLLAAGRVYLVAAVAMIPRLIINLSVDGTLRLTSYRTDYWITKGYVSEIQTVFWDYSGVDEPLGEYLSKLPLRWVNSLELNGQVVLVLAVVATLVALRARSRVFVVACLGAMTLVVTIKQIPPFSRYYAPLWPGLALLVGAGVGALARRPGRATTALAGLVALPAVAVLAGATLVLSVRDYEHRTAVVEARPLDDLADLITDDKGVIGARSHNLLYVTSDIATWGGQFLPEEDYVTYLTWPSDREVVEMMERHDIGWVLVQPKRDLETKFHNAWLVPNYSRRAVHIYRLPESPEFCKVAKRDGYILYRLGACPPDPLTNRR